MPRSKAEDAERKRLYRLANPDKVKASQKKNYITKREKRLAQKREYYAANSERIMEYQRNYRDANPEKLADWRREYCKRNVDQIKNSALKRSGFTLTSKRAMIEAQGNRCAICACNFEDLSAKNIHADHCHATGKPRGVLCFRCNLGIGKFEDNPELLRKAALYLEEMTNAQCQ